MPKGTVEVESVDFDNQHDSSRKGFSSHDRLIVAGSLVLLLLSTYFIFRGDGFFHRKEEGKGEVIASLAKRNHDVRYKVASGVAWSEAVQSQNLYQLDGLFTGEQSQAQINFLDGSQLLMDPKSLVTIRKQGSKTFLEVQSGAMSGILSGKSEIVVVQGKKSHSIKTLQEHTKVTIIANPSGQAKIAVVEGEAELPSQGGMIHLKKDEAAVSKGDGIFVKSDQPGISLLRPAFESALWKEDNEKVTFAWVKNPGVHQYRIEVATSPEFEEGTLVFSKDRVQDEISVAAKSLSFGKPLFWKVIGKAEGKRDQKPVIQESVISRFALYHETAPKPVMPAKSISIKQSELLASEGAAFRWEDDSPAPAYVIEVAQDENFQDIVARRSVSGKEVSARLLLDDAFKNRISLTRSVLFWRVKASDEVNRPNARWSESFDFTLQSEQGEGEQRAPAEKPLPKPKLLQPGQEYEISRRMFENVRKYVAAFFDGLLPSSFAESPLPQALSNGKVSRRELPPIKLGWEDAGAGRSYQLQMSEDVNFGKVLIDVNVDSPLYVWKNHRPGAFYWRVRVFEMTKNGNQLTRREGPWSSTGKLNVRVAPPGSLTETEFTYERLPNQKNPPMVVLSWKKSPWAKAYEVQTASKKDFKNTISRHTPKENTQKVQFQSDGDYFWRVRVLGEKEKPLGSFSAPYPIKVTGKDAKPKRTLASIDQQGTMEVDLGKGALGLSAGLGFTSLSYQETASPSFSEIALTPKLSAVYLLDAATGWNVGVNAFFNAAVIHSSQPSESIQMLGSNIRVGRPIPLMSAPWRVSLYGGLYYVTTASSKSGSIGFKNMMGPQIYPAISYLRSNNALISGYFKYSPISAGANGLTMPNFKSNETALGVSYAIPMNGLQSLSTSLDVSKLSVNFSDVLLIESMSYTLGVAWNW